MSVCSRLADRFVRTGYEVTQNLGEAARKYNPRASGGLVIRPRSVLNR